MASSMITFTGLRKAFDDVVAVDNLNLEIEQGEFFGLLGPNGAGKTTTIGALFGLVKPSGGQITVDGYDAVRDYRTVHQKMGLAPQEENLDFWFMDVKQILVYYAGYFGIRKGAAEERADELLQLMDLWDKRHADVKELSGGMKRRLMLARAVVHDPDIIVMDEPTAGADVALRKKLWNYIRGLQEEGKTIILTTHYIEEAEALCDRVGVMHHGQLLRTETPRQLKQELGHEVIEIRVREQWKRAQNVLASFGDVTMSGKLLEVSVPNAASIAEQLIQQLVTEKIPITHFSVRGNRLEEAYMQLLEEADAE